MLTLGHVQNNTYAVMGLGLSGVSICQALIHSGAHVLAWDDSAQSRHHAQQQGINVIDINNILWHGITALILAPGIPHHLPQAHPIALKALKSNTPIICDVELLLAHCIPATTVGVTGSNGKSTTTALIHHVLQHCQRSVQMGGNIGIPVGDLEQLEHDGIYVLELSSFHLERMPSINVDIAILTNITADHLERHGNMLGYVQAKQYIFQFRDKLQTAIISVDDVYCCSVYDTLKQEPMRTIIPVSIQTSLEQGIYVKDDHLYDNVFTPGQQLFRLTDFQGLKGRHNWQNMLHAYAALRTLNINIDDIYQSYLSFQSLPHRMQSLGFIDTIEFVNDSKATNPDAVAHALAAYDHIYWILGGVAKESTLAGLDIYYPRIKQAFTIGAASELFTKILEPHMPVTPCHDLQQATQQAFKAAARDAGSNASSIVLLSPACASYDQFKNFEERGSKFQQYYEELRKINHGDQC